MEYLLVRSRRKTISVQITNQGQVLVRAPLGCSKSTVDRFVASKSRWIEKHLAATRVYLAAQKEFRPITMETLSFCGRKLRVVPADGNQVQMDLKTDAISFPDVSVEELLPAVGKLYKKAGLPWLEARMDHWAGVMGVSYNRVRFSSALKRWGSCSRDGNIYITWMLLFAPERAIDYVLVHELAHRRFFDHSPAFWDVVRQYMPDYEVQKHVLKNLSETLYAQGWSRKYE